MQYRYVTVDVFTDRPFSGNPLAVVLDASGLSAAHMQRIAAEFNYAETTFVLPAQQPQHTAHVRIYTPRVEVPFAGHPNVGTAVVLAAQYAAAGQPVGDEFLFEEAAGLVPVRLLRADGRVVGAAVSTSDAALCLSLSPADVVMTIHPPRVLSVGLPFLVVELATRDALRRAKPVLDVHERVLPGVGTDSVYAYWRGERDQELHARMFSPIDLTVEDPATGSATAAAIAHLATLLPGLADVVTWRIEQGVDLGRPSLLLGRTTRRAGQPVVTEVGGHAVPVMHGILRL